MKLTLQRINDNGNSTTGILFIDGKFECYTLEDEFREVKIKGETRIPAEFYKVEKRREDSGLTKKYREKHGEFFDFHLMLQNVPGFNYIYIHKGNKEIHTDGCILVGDMQMNNNVFADSDYILSHSTQAFERIYKKISKALELEDVEIEIIDERF